MCGDQVDEPGPALGSEGLELGDVLLVLALGGQRDA